MRLTDAEPRRRFDLATTDSIVPYIVVLLVIMAVAIAIGLLAFDPAPR